MSDDVALLKMGFDTLRSALGLIRDVKDVLPDSANTQVIEASLKASEQQMAIAEVQIAQSLGYALCRCTFPPTPMLKVGHRSPRNGTTTSLDVNECPKCHQNDAAPWDFSRMIGEDET